MIELHETAPIAFRAVLEVLELTWWLSHFGDHLHDGFKQRLPVSHSRLPEENCV